MFNAASVTRFGEFRRFGKTLKAFGQFLVCLILYLTNIGTYFGNFYATWYFLL